MLADDNNGWINGTGDPNTDPAASQEWRYTVTNYLGNSDKLVYSGCPDKKPNPGFPDNRLSYGAYCAFYGWGAHPMHSLYEVRRPSRVFLVAECYFGYPNTPSAFDWTCWGTSGSGVEIQPRHLAGGLNFVFVDGHGEFCKSSGYNLAGSAHANWYDDTPTELPNAAQWPVYPSADMWGDP
jgi:prepilin-type processing-associated H-X9-DG protein